MVCVGGVPTQAVKVRPKGKEVGGRETTLWCFTLMAVVSQRAMETHPGRHTTSLGLARRDSVNGHKERLSCSSPWREEERERVWAACPRGSGLLLITVAPSAISSLWDVGSHTRLRNLSSKSGRGRRSQELWACDWEGPALPRTYKRFSTDGSTPGPDSGTAAVKGE